MNKFQFVLPLVVLLLGPGCQVGRAEEPRAVVERAVEAVGGKALLSQVRAVQLKVKGIYHEVDAAPFTGEVFAQLPAQYKVALQLELAGMPLTHIEVLNGKQGWTRDSLDEQARQVDAEELSEMQHDAYVDYVAGLLPLLDQNRFQLAALEDALIKGKPAVGIRVSSSGKPEVRLYFDKASSLLLKTEHRRQDAKMKRDVLCEEYLSDYRELSATAADESVLKAAKVGLDAEALTDLLRKQTLADANREPIKALIRKLGDPDFQTRERAKDDLIKRGAAALPLLSQAMADADVEIASRAKECIQQIGRPVDPLVCAAAIRVLGRLRPAGVAEVLLAYLPFAPNAEVVREGHAVLAAVAFQDGRPDKALVEALNDKDPQRRKAAAFALGREDAGANAKAGRRLFVTGVKHATKVVQMRDGKKVLEWELVESHYFSAFDGSVFAKP